MDKPAILLLERDASVIDVAQRCLADEIELHVANTVDLAVRIASRRPVVVAVLDATMAGLIPTDTVAKLRGHCPGLRIIFLAEPAFDLDRRYGQLGSVLRKPVVIDRLADAIRNALRLRNMSDGVQRMRTSSGTFPAVRLPDTLAAIHGSGSIPPPSNSTPPPSEPRGDGDPGERARDTAPPERAALDSGLTERARDSSVERWRDSTTNERGRDSTTNERGREGAGDATRSATPRPFARMR